MAGALSKIERQELDGYEGMIEAGYGSVAIALAAIHAKRLYRGTWNTFEAYCEERWQISRSRAYQLIQQAKVSTNVGAPVSEAVARQLAQVPPEQQAAALDAASADGAPTSAKVRQALELFATLTSSEKAQVIGKHEAAGRKLAQKCGARDRVQAIERTVARLKKIHAGLVDVADAADRALDAYLAIVRGTAEAA